MRSDTQGKTGMQGSPGGPRKLRVLLLEDNMRDADLVVRKLKESFELTSELARNSREFKAILERQFFDVIVSDYRLPDWNGLEAIEWLRSAGIRVPFILLTGTLGDEVAIECLKSGVDDYVLKNNLDRLPVAVNRALEEQRLRWERDWAEKELRESENHYRLLFHANPDPMWVFDNQTLGFVAVNSAAVQHYGYSVEEFLAMTIKDICSAEEIPRLSERVNAGAVAGEHDRELWKHEKKDGGVIDVEVSSRPIVYRGISATMALAHDVTEQIKLEQQYRYAQKMEAIGRLAGGVAHDFNNLLMIIGSHAQLIRERRDSPERVHGYVQHILGAVDRATLLTKQLLAFGRKQIQDLRTLDLNAIVPEFSTMLPALLGSDVEVVVRTSPEPCLIRSDRSQIEQVIMNLVVNAGDAMPKGGRLTIETDHVELGDQYFAARGVEAKPGDYVMLAVTDTGTGMDAATQNQIFEPFFTTKEPGKGTGLGLPTVYGIVKQSKGYIWVYSEVGVGTTFKVYFPSAEVPSEAEVSASPEETDARGEETILLVEDEAGLRAAMCDFLGSKGYRVLAASTAAEALRLSLNHPGEIDLLLTDLVMPVVGGMELATKLAENRPRLRVLYMSGYTEQTAKGEGLGNPQFFIQKPFSLAALCSAARRTLDSPPKRPAEFSRWL